MSTATPSNPTTIKRTRHSQIMATSWAQCDAFNARNSLGTKVRYRSLLEHATEYDIKETTTRSEAWTLPSGAAVVLIEGKSGGVSLDHIEVI